MREDRIDLAAEDLCVVVVGSELYLPGERQSCFWAVRQLPLNSAGHLHYLGIEQGQRCYAVTFDQVPLTVAPGEVQTLRSLLGVVSDSTFNMLGRALQVCDWHRDHQFCGRCGSPTQDVAHERARRCPACDLSFYPRIAPCVIVVVERGDRCLLARNARWQANYYSALAGFVEPGESVELALCREVREEVRVEVENLRYFASQPWPFPGQLMLGYHADYKSGEILVDGIEIAEAHWWRYDQLPPGPNAHALSGRLISDFVLRCRQVYG